MKNNIRILLAVLMTAMMSQESKAQKTVQTGCDYLTTTQLSDSLRVAAKGNLLVTSPESAANSQDGLRPELPGMPQHILKFNSYCGYYEGNALLLLLFSPEELQKLGMRTIPSVLSVNPPSAR